MYGEGSGKLSVYVRNNDTTDLGDPVYTRNGQQGKGWYRGLVDINGNRGKFKELIFEAEVGMGQLTDIAIDDVGVFDDENACPLDSLSCDFDQSWCDIKQDVLDDFNFIRQRGSTGSFGTGPETDHSGSGYYIYIESSNSKEDEKARIILPTFRGVQPNDKETFCVIFWYHMYGGTVGELNVYLHNSSSTDLGSPIWWMGGNRGNKWRAAEAEINTPEEFQLYFEAIRGKNYDSDIALDDIQINSFGCPGHHIINNASTVTCDFEEAELCYYRQDDKDDFDWSWRNRGTNDGFTGPEVDHTTGNELGFFVFVSSTYRLKPNYKARLISPPIEANSEPSCVVFWYHMYGDDVETLSVYVRKINGGLGTPQWTLNGNQRNYWHRQTIDIAASKDDYELVFEASPGAANRDDIALDDVTLYHGQDCPSFTTLLPPTTDPPPVVDSIDCDFEEGWCGYTQMTEGDNMDWFRYQGSGYGSLTRGPSNDHTLGNALGYYACFDPYRYNGAGLNDNAILISPLMRGSRRPRCLTFYANMNGYQVDYLIVITRQLGESLPLDPPFSEYGNHGEGWFPLSMDIPGLNQNFQALFLGLCGNSRYYAEIAIDDIKLVEGVCDTSGTTPEPIPWNADCDFEEEEMCGYTIETYGYFHWTRNRAGTGSEDTGPAVDHTLGTEAGHYAYIETSLPARPGDRATLTSSVLSSGSNDICVRFYYHAYGEDIGFLTVKYVSIDYYNNEVLFSVAQDQGNEWRPANVDLPATLTGMSKFQIAFEGRKGSSYKGDIAIDDIKFLAQPCAGFPTESRCTFEQGSSFCGYQINKMSNGIPWKWFDALASDPTPLNMITSSFMYVEGSTLNMGRQAVLYSQVHNLQGMDHCLTADFILTEDPSQQITIEVMEKDTVRKYQIDTLIGDMGNSWFRGNWSIPSTMVSVRPFKIAFTARPGSAGVMAIDNVIVTSQLEACAKYIPPPTKPATTTPSPTTTSQSSTKPMTKPMKTNPTQKPAGNSKLGIIIGVTIAVVVVIGIVVIVAVCKFSSGSSMPFGVSYKNERLDEIPFSGVTPRGAINAPTDPTVVFTDPVEANGSSKA
ncbi:MAM and LDL-receptor class A domain-containing protein 1-like [Lytechinus variegatus]|uniref:MAM and LDL-receptor class A domain-containing protein 1-like n=1 Tax=Lytechinus variegatus TaxID=7654 RepID=UPI001BB2129C|nr:MAM and LDL-receptor class A domain-containing protein 1-like [Lytechinus variegatus]